MKTVAQIRQEFLDYFKNQGHEIVPSSPVIPIDDPTLLFTNAGMNQFKDVFLGTGKRSYSRAADTQKCIRAGGKHNDLEEVGYDTYHHTFFEMLGNWSFGDYYKKDAIVWAWDLLTNVWGLPKDKLYATVYKTDNEAEEIWKTHTDINPEHVLRFDEKDNFWEMADTGPCGPCSEIHIDRGEEYNEQDGKDWVNSDSQRYIELWNLVFIQYERLADGSLVDLPEKHVDTGMGLERVAAVLQNVRSNYDTGLFKPIIDAVEKLSGVTYEDGPKGQPHRAIADHMRAVSTSIADGASIGNNGREYVLRRILRRASRFLQGLGVEEPGLYKLVPAVIDILGDTFPELVQQQSHIETAIKTEEIGFHRTLKKGLGHFHKVLERTRDEGKNVISGEEAFDLYGTYGFPLDLTVQMAREHGCTVDEDGFNVELQKERKKGQATQSFNKANLGEYAEVEATEFLGHELDNLDEEVRVLRANDTEMVLNKTPFYPEGGGPKGDKGVIASVAGGGFEFVVEDTQKQGDVIIHHGHYRKGSPANVSGPVEAIVDFGYREAIKRNHTGTHILHWALRNVLGDHVVQKGSIIKPESFTFDFTHPSALTDSELTEIERLINEKILENNEVTARETTLDEAKEQGAIAFFGEKYGETVRVLSIGDGYSTELCGGVHCELTGDIGSLKIVRESSVSSGIRRVECVSGAFAFEHAMNTHRTVQALSAQLKAPVSELLDKVSDLQKRVKELKKLAKQAKKEQSVSPKDLLGQAEVIGGVKVLISKVEGDAGALRRIGDSVKAQSQPTIALLLAEGPKGVTVLGVCTEDMVNDKGSADVMARQSAQVLGGNAGGRKNFAQGKGKDAGKIPEALEAAKAYVSEWIGS